MKVCLIGAGNLGTQLGKALFAAGHDITQVFSRDFEHAQHLADQVSALPLDRLMDLQSDAEMYLLTVPDDAIQKVAQEIQKTIPENAILVHCSGNTSDNAVALHKRHGVIWPLQSLSKDQTTDFLTIPVILSADSDETYQKLEQLARSLSDQIYRMDDAKRQKVHVAAVIVNNFTNLLFREAHNILEKEDIPFKVLLPLIRYTVEKLDDLTPEEAQTGPAKRNDLETMRQHLTLLEEDSELREIYIALSKRINREVKF